MTSVIMISHGKFASAVKQSAEMIIEKRENVYCLEVLEEESLDDFTRRVEEVVSRIAGDIIVASDFPLSTPFNAALMVMKKCGICHITGLSMQMALVLLHPDNTDCRPEELCRMAVEKARADTIYVNDFGGQKD